MRRNCINKAFFGYEIIRLILGSVTYCVCDFREVVVGSQQCSCLLSTEKDAISERPLAQSVFISQGLSVLVIK